MIRTVRLRCPTRARGAEVPASKVCGGRETPTRRPEIGSTRKESDPKVMALSLGWAKLGSPRSQGFGWGYLSRIPLTRYVAFEATPKLEISSVPAGTCHGVNGARTPGRNGTPR